MKNVMNYLLETEESLKGFLMHFSPLRLLLENKWISKISHKEANMLVSMCAFGHKDVTCMQIQMHNSVLMSMINTLNDLDYAGENAVADFEAVLTSTIEGPVQNGILETIRKGHILNKNKRDILVKRGKAKRSHDSLMVRDRSPQLHIIHVELFVKVDTTWHFEDSCTDGLLQLHSQGHDCFPLFRWGDNRRIGQVFVKVYIIEKLCFIEFLASLTG